MLRDLTIQNYRCFKDFHIDGLARVNLIVGKNNSGKTSLLEAIYLLVNQGDPNGIFTVLHNRSETNRFQVMHIFNSHQLQTEQTIHIQSQKEHQISLEIQLKAWSKARKAPTEFVPVFELIFVYTSESSDRVSTTILPIHEDGSLELLDIVGSERPGAFTQFCRHFYLTTRNIDLDLLNLVWNYVAHTPKEESVVAAIQILEPDVEHISFTSDDQGRDSRIWLKLRGQPIPIPLGSMGEGMRRLLTLAITVVATENGILLVDEIDTGLYYESQTDMWRLILAVAQQLNVQVFATTHSWDCIAAFQEALNQIEDSSVGKLFRLSRKGENIRPVDYPAEKLAVAVRQNIEVR